MILSLQNRNYMVSYSADVVLRIALFFSIFLPLGRVFSLDARQAGSPSPARHSFCSAATFGIICQTLFMYWFSVGFKLAPKSFPVWWEAGSAVYYTLSLDQYATWLGHLLLLLPLFVLRLITYGVLLAETIGPVLLIWPATQPLCRCLGILTLAGLQISLGSCLSLDIFPLISMVMLLPLLPSEIWDKWLPEQLRLKTSAFWNSFVNFTAVKDGSIQNTSAAKPSFVFLKKPFSLLVNLFVFSCVLYTLLWNWGGLHPEKQFRGLLWKFGKLTGLRQEWKMFAPPLRTDGWFVIPGTLKNKQKVDIFRNGAQISFDKPADVKSVYQSERERKYMQNLVRETTKEHRRYYGQYLCRDWNSRNSEEHKLVSFEVIHMQEKTLPDRRPSKIEKKPLWKHWCYQVPEKIQKKFISKRPI